MESRYAALAREIARDIAGGKHPVGSLLPGELELTERHGVSRSTVRSALQQLQDLGLISRHKRIGTRVEASRPHADYAPSLATLEDLIHFAAEAERRVRTIEEVVADDELAARLGCRPGQRWLLVTTTRSDPHQPERPIACTSVYVDPAYGKAVRQQVRRSTQLVSAIIEQEYGIYATEVDQEIRAIAVPTPIARLLKCDPETPALEITRHYRDPTGRAFEITVSVHPAKHFSYALKLRRRTNGSPIAS